MSIKESTSVDDSPVLDMEARLSSSSDDDMPAAPVANSKQGTSDKHDKKKKKDKKQGPNLAKIFRGITGKEKAMLVIAALFAMVKGFLPALNFLVLGAYLDDLVGGITTEALNKVVLTLLIIGCTGSLCDCVSTYCMDTVSVRNCNRRKELYVKSLLKQDQAYFDMHDPLSFTTTLYMSALQLRDGSGVKLSLFITAVFSIIANYVVAIYKDWRMALTMAVGTPLVAGFASTLFGKFGSYSAKSIQEYAPCGALAEEAVGSIRTVTAYGIADATANKFDELLQPSQASWRKGRKFKACALLSIVTIITLQHALGWWVSALYFNMDLENGCFFLDPESTGCFSPGTAITVFTLVILSGQQFQQVAPNISAMIQATQGAAAFDEVIDYEPNVMNWEPDDGVIPRSEERLGDIELRKITFAYPTRPDFVIYKDMDCTLQQGKSYALVGPSGCGKSTIISLIQRMYKPNGGDIWINGRPLEQWSIPAYRTRIALVSQEPRLFCKSIYENVAIGIQDRSRFTKEEEFNYVVKCLKIASAWDFVEKLEDGMLQNVGPGGNLLSGGQKQRVAIARAVARDPDLLILDEATSALDNKSEAEVQAAIDNIIGQGFCTTITIAHRLSTVRNCSEILVFKRLQECSVIVERGNHDELMAKEGVYQSLYDAQRLSSGEKKNSVAASFVVNTITGFLDVPEEIRTGLMRQYSRELDIADAVAKNEQKEAMKSFKQRRKEKRIVEKEQQKRMKGITKGIIKTSFKRRPSNWIFGSILAALCGCYFPLMPLLNAQAVTGLTDGIHLETCSQNLIDYLCTDPTDPRCPANGGVFPPTEIPAGYNSFIDFCDVDYDEIKAHGEKWGLVYLGMACFGGIFFGSRDFIFSGFGQDIMDSFRSTVFRRIINHDITFFDDIKNNPGGVSDVLASDCKNVEGLVGDNMWIFIQVVAMTLLAVIYSFTKNWELALIAMLQPLVTAPGTYKLTSSVKRGQQVALSTGQTQEDQLDVGSVGFVMNEIIQNLRPISAYNLQNQMFGSYRAAGYKEFKADISSVRKNSVFAAFSGGTTYFANALTFWYAGNLMMDVNFGIPYEGKEPIDLVTFIAIFSLYNFVGQTIGNMIGFGSDTGKGKSSMYRIQQVLNYHRVVDQTDESGIVLPDDMKGGIEARHIEFQYPCRLGVQVYKDVTFKTKGGQSIALIGPSGAGKSTFIQLLQRFYSLQPGPKARNFGGEDISCSANGAIKIDDIDINEIQTKSLRSKIALVEQMPLLFSSLTIGENIGMGKHGLGQLATQEEIEIAARAANAHEFIRGLPQGYETNVGLGGGSLSGGQKQRIAIARALIRDPKILLLDEATSALDAESEKQVQAALSEISEKYASGITTITIAHRLSTVKDCDVIICLNNDGGGSEVVETGNHEELLAAGGLYKQMVLAAER